MSETPVRFGVLGCATIARILSKAIRLAPNASISAIGSRSIDKASKFASDNGFPASAKVYGSYEAVLDDPEVDAVYVPLPTSLHLKWPALAAEKKKHLLLEKPVALDVRNGNGAGRGRGPHSPSSIPDSEKFPVPVSDPRRGPH
ncbi:hypothetical protein CsSME_00035309 [Camellia sinensis var. sinensis]